MVIDVDYTIDNITRFRPIGCTLRDRKLDYAEPRLASARITKNPLSLEIVNVLILTQPPNEDPRTAPSEMTPPKHPRHPPSTTPTKVNSFSPSNITKMHLHNIPDIRPCDTAYPSDTR